MLETDGFGFAGQVRQDDPDISAEIPQELATCATGCRELIRVGDDNDPDEVACPFRKSFEQSNPFRTNRQTVAGTFNVAAGEHSPVSAEQR